MKKQNKNRSNNKHIKGLAEFFATLLFVEGCWFWLAWHCGGLSGAVGGPSKGIMAFILIVWVIGGFCALDESRRS